MPVNAATPKTRSLSISLSQSAVTNYQGWDTPATVEHSGQHPESEKSTLIYLSRTDEARYGAPEILISILLHMTDDALQPIRSVEPLTPGTLETIGGLRVTLKSGERYNIDFRGIDGSSSR